jgi:acyl-CoA thioester hydrolase
MLEGRFEGKTHILPVRVYYEDTDVSGMVYHANYLRYMERGRSEFFRAAGITKLAQLEAPEPTAWSLTKAAIEYRRPAKLDDVIEVHTRCMTLSGARLVAAQKCFCNGTLLTEAEVEACLVTLTGKPRRIPEKIRTMLSAFLVETDA